MKTLSRVYTALTTQPVMPVQTAETQEQALQKQPQVSEAMEWPVQEGQTRELCFALPFVPGHSHLGFLKLGLGS